MARGSCRLSTPEAVAPPPEVHHPRAGIDRAEPLVKLAHVVAGGRAGADALHRAVAQRDIEDRYGRLSREKAQGAGWGLAERRARDAPRDDGRCEESAQPEPHGSWGERSRSIVAPHGRTVAPAGVS